MRDLTDKPFGVNIAQMMVSDPGIVDFVHDQGVRFVTTSAGDPSVYTGALHDAGITVFHVVPSLRAALKAVAAGRRRPRRRGRRGRWVQEPRDVASMVLIPLVCSKVDVPVVAAGGITDGRTMAAAFVLGAEGVQMGTRFSRRRSRRCTTTTSSSWSTTPETGTVMLNRFHKPGYRVLATPLSEAHEERGEPVTLGSLDDILDLYFERRPRRRVRVRRPGRRPHRRRASRWPRSSPTRSRSSTTHPRLGKFSEE